MANGSGVTLGYLKYVLGLDSLAFQEGLGDADKRVKAATKSIGKTADKFKSVGAALSIGVTAPFTALIASSIPAAKESLQAVGQVQAALASMGDAAGRTLPQLDNQAKALMRLSTFDDDDILRKVTANLLTFGNVSGEVFDRAQLAAVNLSARLGQDLQSSAIQLGKALNNPIKGLTALSRVGVSFTADQQAQVKVMVAAGNAAGAQKLILGELEKQYGGAAKALRDATPGIDSQQAWADFQETVGGFALKVLPPLTAVLTKVLNYFNDLSPTTQKFAIGLAAAAAAIGPLSFGFGTLLSTVAPVLARMGVAAAAGGLPALTAVFGPLAIAVGAVVLAWQNWDKIGPILEGVAKQAQTQTASIDGYLKKITGSADDLDKRLGVPSKDEFLSSLGQWIAKTWTTVNQYDLAKWAAGVDAAILKAFSNAVASAERLYVGVKTWLRDRLGPIFTWVADKAKVVGDAFFKLYDRVVGHSYVPDMVDEIGVQMARLDGVLVKPVQIATGKTADAFRDLKERLNGVLNRIFPEQSELRDLQAQMADIDLPLAKGIGDPAVWRVARNRVQAQIDALVADAKRSADEAIVGSGGDLAAGGDVFADIEALGDKTIDTWSAIGAANDNLVKSFAETAAGVVDSIGGLVSNLRSKDFLGALEGVLDVILRLGDAGVFGKGVQSNVRLAGARADGGPVSGGRTYLVGERGPELFTASRSGFVHPNSATARNGRSVSFDLRGAVMTSDLVAQMQVIANDTTGSALTEFGAASARLRKRQIGRR